MNALVEHHLEALIEQDLDPGTYLETDVLLPRQGKKAMQAWLQAQGYGNVTFWEPSKGGYRLSIHRNTRKLLPTFQRAAGRF